MCPESGFRIALNWSKIRKMTVTSQFANMTSLSIFFDACLVSLVKFKYWPKFHVNIITGSGVMIIYLYKGHWPEIRKLEIPRLSFAQYLEAGASSEYQIWHGCL